MDKRKFVDFDMDNFDRRMEAIKPAISFMVPNKLGEDAGGEKISVKLEMNKMDDFSPAAVARQVDSTRKLLEAREQLSNLLRYMDGKIEAEGELKKLLSDKKLMELVKDRLAAPEKADSDEG
jgi:type VI secretion system protein ImpB